MKPMRHPGIGIKYRTPKHLVTRTRIFQLCHTMMMEWWKPSRFFNHVPPFLPVQNQSDVLQPHFFITNLTYTRVHLVPYYDHTPAAAAAPAPASQASFNDTDGFPLLSGITRWNINDLLYLVAWMAGTAHPIQKNCSASHINQYGMRWNGKLIVSSVRKWWSDSRRHPGGVSSMPDGKRINTRDACWGAGLATPSGRMKLLSYKCSAHIGWVYHNHRWTSN